jgi:hypothetical protein
MNEDYNFETKVYAIGVGGDCYERNKVGLY